MKKIAIFLGVVFFVLEIVTLSHYNINWDAINHLPRGQAYLNYFLTGKKDYSGLPEFFGDWFKKDQWYFQNPRSLAIDTNIPQNKVPPRSLYQLDDYNFKYFIANDGYGHPPLSDILSSLFNRVFFSKLKIINDIDSYHLYGVVLASLLVVLMFLWVSEAFDKFAGLVSFLALSTYPLFWSESHFNTEKDVPETVFMSFMLFGVWRGITKKSWKWMLFSGVSFGLALGTKFNILFALPIIAIWLIYFLALQFFKEKKSIASIIKNNVWIIPASFVAISIGILIFVAFWPYLWPDPLSRIVSVIKFYREIGVTSQPDPRFLGPFNINTYPILTVIYTTPVVTLLLVSFGVLNTLKKLGHEEKGTSFLFLIWFILPIARVSWPGANIYGGLRQIMEYIPAMAALAGVGAYFVREKLSKKIRIIFTSLIIILCFVPIVVKLIQIHPNENAYFNLLIGGLAGAKKQDYPYWGNTFGAAYRQGVNWLNDNAQKDAHIVFAYELIPNVPRIFFRQDLVLYNGYRSGYLKAGEYAMTLTFQGTSERSYYDSYLERMLNPVYSADVDGVSVLKIWKNDKEHTKKEFLEEKILSAVKLTGSVNGIVLDLGTKVRLSRMEGIYSQVGCLNKINYSFIQISDDEKNWKRLPGVLPSDWLITALGEQPKNGRFIHPFAGDEARFIGINIEPRNTCFSELRNIKVYYFDK